MSTSNSDTSGPKYRPPKLRARQNPINLPSSSEDEKSLQKSPLKLPQRKGLPADTSSLQKRAERFQNDQRVARTDYGFVSRGEDTRLQRSEEERHAYFDSILKQFVEYCETNSDSGFDIGRLAEKESELQHKGDEKGQNTEAEGSNGIPKNIEKTNIDTQSDKHTDSRFGILRGIFYASKAGPKVVTEPTSPTIDSILVSLRKLREALLHTRPDDFSRRVFLFSVRVSAPVGHYQTYVPSIHYLLRNGSCISDAERREMALLLVLHISHVNGDNAHAFRVFHTHLDPDADMKTLIVLESWVLGDYGVWVRMYNLEADTATAAVMAVGVRKVVTHMVACISRAYFNLLTFALEEWLPRGVTIATLQEEYGLKWRVEGDNVVVRERRR